MAEVPKRMSLRIASWVSLGSVAACAIIWMSRGIYVYWNDGRIVNFLAAWIPFVLSILLAFVPEREMTTIKKLLWRSSVIAVGFAWSVVLWHQQVIADQQAKSDQQQIVADAVGKSNQHSDQQIGAVRTDVQGVKSDMQAVKRDLENKFGEAISKSTSSLSESIVKAGKPELAHVQFTFWPTDLKRWPIVETKLPLVNGAVEVSLTFRATGHMAKGLKI
jgi:hypothetical protein